MIPYIYMVDFLSGKIVLFATAMGDSKSPSRLFGPILAGLSGDVTKYQNFLCFMAISC